MKTTERIPTEAAIKDEPGEPEQRKPKRGLKRSMGRRRKRSRY